MRNRRTCADCRIRKVKCDFSYPACSSCVRRNTRCVRSVSSAHRSCHSHDGTTSRGHWRLRNGSLPYDLSTSGSLESGVDSWSSQRDAESATIPFCMTLERELPTQAPKPLDAVNQYTLCGDDPSAYLSSPLLRNQDMRAVDRFFLDWVMYPCCTVGVCPGYLASIPALYHGSQQNDLLHWTVQAMAYSTARMCRADDGVSFEVKARTCYGKAVQCLRHRVATSSSRSLHNDEVLASILLLDQWELTYANRNTLCGSHGPILLHILTQRPNLQAASAASDPLSQAASYRLLCHLLMANEEDKLQQLSMSFDWDGSALYTYMATDVFHIVALRAEIRAFTRLLDTRSDNDVRSTETHANFADLVSRVRNFVSRPPQWVWDVPESWKPRLASLGDIYDSAVTCHIIQHRLGLPDQSVLKFHGLWVACMWASHWACLILLHDCLVDAIKRHSESYPEAHGVDGFGLMLTSEDEAACGRHAIAIFQAIPFIMGHVTARNPSHQPSCESGRMLARLFALFPLFVLESSPSVTAEQRLAATSIKRWLQEGHQIN